MRPPALETGSLLKHSSGERRLATGRAVGLFPHADFAADLRNHACFVRQRGVVDSIDDREFWEAHPSAVVWKFAVPGRKLVVFRLPSGLWKGRQYSQASSDEEGLRDGRASAWARMPNTCTAVHAIICTANSHGSSSNHEPRAEL